MPGGRGFLLGSIARRSRFPDPPRDRGARSWSTKDSNGTLTRRKPTSTNTASRLARRHRSSSICWLWTVPMRIILRTRSDSSASADPTSTVSSWLLMRNAAIGSESSARGWQNPASEGRMNDQAPEHDDLRPEVDFSRAVRGKHAKRFAVSRDEPPPPWLRDALRYDRQAWISEALRHCQKLEGLLVAYLTLAFQLEPADAGKDVSLLLEDRKDKTLRRVSRDLSLRAQSSTGDLKRRLDHLFRERNWLIHRSLQQQSEGATPRSAGRFTARLQELSSEAAALTEELRQLIVARFERVGISQTEFEEKAQDAIQQWLAA